MNLLLMIPILYKNPSELDESFYTAFEFGDFVDGGNIAKFDYEESVGVTQLGADSYIIKTENYTVIHQNNGFVLINNNGEVYTYGSKVNVIGTSQVNVDSGGTVNVYSADNITVTSSKNVSVSGSNVTINGHLKVTK